jgi:general secretion pathway protein H
MIEVMVVVALIAIAAGVVSLSLRDGSADRLEREAARLSALLESARAEARASALPVRWLLTPESSEHAFRFVGLPPSRKMPTQWLDSGVVARFDDNLTSLALGPEALIGAQGVQLQLDRQRVHISTDGLRPFSAQPVEAAPP